MLFAAALDVILDELFRVLFENRVDLIEQTVHLLFKILALLSHLLATFGVAAFTVAFAATLLLLLLLARRHIEREIISCISG
jgi:hypothetical protein